MQLPNLPAGVQDGGMVTPTEGFADLRQAEIGQFIGQRHGDLPGAGQKPQPTVGQQVADRNLVVVRHSLLNILDGDQLVLQRSAGSLNASLTKAMVMARPVNWALA